MSLQSDAARLVIDVNIKDKLSQRRVDPAGISLVERAYLPSQMGSPERMIYDIMFGGEYFGAATVYGTATGAERRLQIEIFTRRLPANHMCCEKSY